MPVEIKQEADVTNITFDGEFNMFTIKEVKEDLFGFFSQHNPDHLCISLADVSEFDTAALQLLMMLEMMALKANGKFQVTSMSEPAQKIIDFVELSERWSGQPGSELDSVNLANLEQ